MHKTQINSFVIAVLDNKKMTRQIFSTNLLSGGRRDSTWSYNYTQKP